MDLKLQKLKRLKTLVPARSKKNWKWYADINPDGRYKARKRRVKIKNKL